MQMLYNAYVMQLITFIRTFVSEVNNYSDILQNVIITVAFYHPFLYGDGDQISTQGQ
jgi:hypothetical protein